MGVPPAQKGRAGRPSHNSHEKWILFNSHPIVKTLVVIKRRAEVLSIELTIIC